MKMFNPDLAWEEVNKYLNLDIYGKKIVCPYFTNHIGKAFMDSMRDGGLTLEIARNVIKNFNDRKYPLAWWRGKGTPEQIVEATIKIAEIEKVNLTNASAEAIREFMLLHGLGVDCSGMVYNVLSTAGLSFDLLVNKASAATFEPISKLIDFKEVASGDIILIKNKELKYSHVALVLMNSGLRIVQSTSMTPPAGIFVNDLKTLGKEPVFGFKSEIGTDWGELWQENRLEFRRLV